MKSHIKRDYVLKYILDKFNVNTQDVDFLMGRDGMPLYQPLSKEASEGDPNNFEFINTETYQYVKKEYVPVSVIAMPADFSNLTNIEQTQRITSSSWSAVVEFLVFTDSYVHNKIVFAMEEFRDKFFGKIDFLEGKEWDYDLPSNKPTKKYYNVVTHCTDLTPSSIITINGINFISYTFEIELEVNDELAFGNQFEFYIKQDGGTYERVLPITASWGSSNTLEGKQLLNNVALSGDDLKKAQQVHNIVASRGWAINFSFMFQPTSDIIRELFKETFKYKTSLNEKYHVKMLFKEKEYDSETGIPSYVESDDIKFEFACVTGDGGTEVVYGDNVIFAIGFAPSWT